MEAASELFDEALISYTRALQLDPHNVKVMESIKNITDTQKKKIRGLFQLSGFVCKVSLKTSFTY